MFFQPDLIRNDGGPDTAEYFTPFLFQDSQFPHVLPARSGVPSQIFDLMQRIRAELPATSVRGRLAVKTYLKMILILLVNQYSSYAGTVETFERQQRALERLRPLFDYVGKHYDKPIQVQEAARICGMSESHFMNFFKRTTGQSFLAYLNHCRIERAQMLLVGTDKSVSDISQEMGFCDQSYFGTVFRRMVGMTPAAYRRRLRNPRIVPASRGRSRRRRLPWRIDCGQTDGASSSVFRGSLNPRSDPPSQAYNPPVQYADSSEARKTASPAMSSGLPSLPIGTASRSPLASAGSASRLAFMGVSIVPGIIELTRMPSARNSPPSPASDRAPRPCWCCKRSESEHSREIRWAIPRE